MTTPSYKTGGSWTAIPTAACYGTHNGNWYLRYPPATDIASDGTPCGAVGRPEIVIETAWLTDTGFDFWRDLFSSATATYVAVEIEAFNPRSGSKEKFSGKLNRPTFSNVGPGGSTGTTIYRNVKILITNCVTTT